MRRDISYRIYPSLLDSYQNYLDSEQIYSKYWGWSENPPKTFEEFEQEQFQSIIDRINRVPQEYNEAAAIGTAFNELVDCIIEHRKSDKIHVEYEYEKLVWGDVSGLHGDDGDQYDGDVEFTDKIIGFNVTYNEHSFYFPIGPVMEVANYYKGAITQKYVDGVLPTEYGNVYLYGYVDELMPVSVHDIKTTSSYYVGKFKKNFQHLVYPYCLSCMGSEVNLFEYNVVDMKNYETFTETYVFNKDRDIPILQERIEDFISFLEDNRSLITDKKIFNYE